MTDPTSLSQGNTLVAAGRLRDGLTATDDGAVLGRLRSGAQPEPAPANSVVYALVVALLDLEQRRDRGKVRRPMARNAAR
jgi:hypothetical protein